MFLNIILLSIYFLSGVSSSVIANSSIDIEPNQPILVNINRLNTTVVVRNLSVDISYVTCQIHSQTKNLTLSSTPTPSVGKSVTGVDLGMVTVLEANQTEVIWYITSNHSQDVQALVAVFPMSGNAPLIGGCNLEFPLEIDANLLVSYTTTKNLVEFQWANVPLGPRSTPRQIIPTCEDQVYQDWLEYSIYVRYLSGNNLSPESYFKALKKMLTPEDIIKNGVKLSSMTNRDISQKPEFLMAAYPGTGAVYTMVVKAKTPTGVTMAAYFPKVTYSCDLQQMDGCTVYGAAWLGLCCVLGLVGVFLSFLGHRFFKTGLFLCAFLGFCIIYYSVLSLYSTQNYIVLLLVTVILSVVSAILWVVMYELLEVATISVLLSGLLAGYLVSSIVFYTPFGNLSYWDRPFNYAMAFTCGVLAIPVFILAYTKTLNILSCSFVGSYLIVLVPDVFLSSGMKYIVLTSIRHSTDVSYVNVLNTAPFTIKEIILTCVWFLLFALGAIFQFYRDWGRPDFPTSRRRCGRRVEPENDGVPARYSVDPEEDSGEDPDERSPLLRHTVNRHHRDRVLVPPS